MTRQQALDRAGEFVQTYMPASWVTGERDNGMTPKAKRLAGHLARLLMETYNAGRQQRIEDHRK